MQFNKIYSTTLLVVCMSTAAYCNQEIENSYNTNLSGTLSSALSGNPNKEIKLPDLSSGAELSLSTEEEQKIRQKIINQLRKSTNLIEDIELSNYIKQLGLKLIGHTDFSYKQFDFYLFNSSQVNAFATPGGVIVIYTGLFTSTESESELASVVAHEIAHVTQEHIARAIQQAQEMNVPVTLGLIAAVLLGATTSTDVGIASITGLSAFTQQQQINFTREHEIEADSVGINTLHAAGFSPYGMAGFFQKLNQNSQYMGDNIPEFLRTHPITLNRLSDATTKAQSLNHNLQTSVYKINFNYRLMKMRADVLTHNNQMQVINKYKQLMSQHSIDKNPEYFYAYAVSLEETQQYHEAIPIYEELLHLYPKELTYIVSLARALAKTQDKEQQNKAISMLQNVHNNKPYDPIINYYYAQILNQAKQYQLSIDTLNQFLNYADKQAIYYQLLSIAYNGLGEEILSSIAQADYFILNHEYVAAKNLLDIAFKKATDNFYQQSLIQAKLKDINQHIDKKKKNKL
ncbi:MAG: M48 family metallopeptidase [Gammaproteobacteria bacterium]|nr:M48 family metallopeptidase [Gammaproteobacteria bacterium]